MWSFYLDAVYNLVNREVKQCCWLEALENCDQIDNLPTTNWWAKCFSVFGARKYSYIICRIRVINSRIRIKFRQLFSAPNAKHPTSIPFVKSKEKKNKILTLNSLKRLKLNKHSFCISLSLFLLSIGHFTIANGEHNVMTNSNFMVFFNQTGCNADLSQPTR